jgi:hypothetical protein
MKDHGQRGDWIYQTIEDPENKTNLDRFIDAVTLKITAKELRTTTFK